MAVPRVAFALLAAMLASTGAELNSTLQAAPEGGPQRSVAPAGSSSGKDDGGDATTTAAAAAAAAAVPAPDTSTLGAAAAHVSGEAPETLGMAVAHGGELTLGVNASVFDLAQGRAFRCGGVICPHAAICCQSHDVLASTCCGLPLPLMAYPYTTSVCRFNAYSHETHRKEQNVEGRGWPQCLACDPKTGNGCANPRGGSAYYGQQ